MNSLRINIWHAVCCLSALSLSTPVHAFDGRTENFDTNWPSGLIGATYTNIPTTNPVSGWVVNYVRLANAGVPLSGTNVAEIQSINTTSNGWVQSPLFTDGIGKFRFYVRTPIQPVSFNVESSSDGVGWVTNSSHVLSVTTWEGHTNTYNTTNALYLRIRKTTDNLNRVLRIDNCSVSYLPAQLTITNASISPMLPLTGDGVTVNAQISIEGVTGNEPALTTYWRDLFSPTWSSLAMASNVTDGYSTTSTIPARPAGAVIEYYVRAVYDDGNGVLLTNTYPAAGAGAPLSYTIRERATFTSMMVQGAVNTNMLLVSPYQWQAAVTTASMTNPTFNFRGLSNAVATTWGDADQSVFTLPAYGTAEMGSSTITVAGAVNTALNFQFNEQSGAYVIQPCAYDNLESWTNRPFGIYTNSGWVLSKGWTTNDAGRAFQGSYAVLNTNANSFFQSPYLTNGIGQISFWLRSYENDGSPTGVIAVQKAASPTSTWTTLITTNIVSTNYLYVSISQSDRNSHCIRILNNTNGNNAAVCLDEVVIGEPGAGVTYSNLVSTPSPVTILDPVTVEINIDPLGGATDLQAWTLFRFGTNGLFDTLPMTNDFGNHFVTTEPIPPSGTGTIQYLVLCSYTGFQSEASSPVYLPPDTNSPNSYLVQAPTDGRTENFDTNWPSGLISTTYTNIPTTNPVSGWVVNNARVTVSGAMTLPYVAMILDTNTYGNGWVQTPLFTNGIGSLIFYIRTSVAPITYNVESSTDGVEWATNFSGTLTVTTWEGHTNTYNTTNALYLRIRKTSDDRNRFLRFDNCSVSYPPARVAISDVALNPGYPSTADTVNVSCIITSANAMFPAMNITPTFYYRKGGVAATNYIAIPMAYGAGNRYATFSSAIPAFPRDTLVEYYIRCDFHGYYGSDGENQSPTLYPATGASAPASYVVRAFASPYQVIQTTVNGMTVGGRLLHDRTWQAVTLISALTNRLAITLNGLGYSVGTGYAANPVSWGNTNNWQTALPLADQAGTNQAALSITGSFQGQYVIRFNELTGEYTIQQCVWQDFDSWPGTAGTYVQSANDNATPAVLTFDTWTNNVTRVRNEPFSGGIWPTILNYTNNAVGDTNDVVINASRIDSVTPQGYVVRTRDTAVAPGQGFAAVDSQKSFSPLRGIGTISAKYRPYDNTDPTMSFGVYLQPTNSDYISYTNWMNLFSASNLTNDSKFATVSLTVRTNQSYTVIFAHVAGSHSLYMDDLSVSEWYADTLTVDGWTASECWIELSQKAGGTNCCRFDVTQADPGTTQYIQSPRLSNGVNTISFQYSGISNYPASFDLQVSYSGTSSFASVYRQTNAFAGAGANYTNVAYVLKAASNSIYVRIVNTTPRPGVLLLDNIRISSYALPDSWAVNNAAIDDSDQSTPPLSRQFYAGAGYLNSNRTSNISIDPATAPATNLHSYIRSPTLENGIGEISFWYRNWATSGTSFPPAKVVVQVSTLDSTNNSDWTTVTSLTNIVNTNDYLYFSTSTYDRVSRFVRIYNNDTSGPVSRVCLDDILVTAPLAATLSMSNLTITPLIPLYTNSVDVYVDVYHLFMNPSNITLRALYGVATNYAGLTNVALTACDMTCVASNLTVPGRWFRYKTSSAIPPQEIDRFVRYGAKASWAGAQAQIASPQTNQAFGIYPTWYDPMNAVYGTNMAYYVVYSCPTGAVWFNEINCIDVFDGINGCWTNEYVEVCGPQDINLRNWRIEVFNAAPTLCATYVITNDFVIPNDSNGRGFWVLGDRGVPNVNTLLTTIIDEGYGDTNQNLPFGGGLVLKRSFGSIEQKISYNAIIPGFSNVGDDYNRYDAGTLGLRGSGTNYRDFVWGEAPGYSAGSQNAGQSIYGVTTPQNVVPSVAVTAFWVQGTSVWIVCTRTNGWYPAPWVSTNLTISTAWTNAQVLSSVLSATNATFQCATNRVSPAFYRITATNSP